MHYILTDLVYTEQSGIVVRQRKTKTLTPTISLNSIDVIHYHTANDENRIYSFLVLFCIVFGYQLSFSRWRGGGGSGVRSSLNRMCNVRGLKQQ